MPTLRFYGKVFPLNIGSSISTPELPSLSYDVAPGVRVSHVARVDNGLIGVTSDINEFKDEFISEILKGAIDAATTAIDMVAYANGWGFSTQLESAQLPDGSLISLVYDMQELVGICTAFKPNSTDPKDAEEFRKIYATALNSPALSLAFGDLIQAATAFHVAPQNCGRVIDALRMLLSPNLSPKDDRGHSWRILRETVRADKPYLDFVMNLSHGPRDGDRTPIAGDEIRDCVRRTWIVMNRFLEFVKRGCEPLPESEFEELQG